MTTILPAATAIYRDAAVELDDRYRGRHVTVGNRVPSG